ncbi:hypothetical protein LSAT2_021372 [Lamellibrachia satsuma]|nr:hypothetical protein LSAT2_021372 [Lamellibrachia satsuma]
MRSYHCFIQCQWQLRTHLCQEIDLASPNISVVFKLWHASVCISRKMENSVSTSALLCGRQRSGATTFANSGKRTACNGVFSEMMSDQKWSIGRVWPSSSNAMTPSSNS